MWIIILMAVGALFVSPLNLLEIRKIKEKLDSP